MVNIGLAGAGVWGRQLLRNFVGLSECRVVSVCDISDRVRTAVSGQYPGMKTFDRFEDMVADRELEAVVVATTPDSHFKLALSALQAGKDVFVEKPLVLTVEDAKRLIDAADELDRILMVGHIMVYHPAVLKLRSLIDSGELGEVYYLYGARLNLGKVRDIENALWSFAPHDVSIVLYLLGKEPETVTTVGSAYLQKDRRIEDVSFMTLHFADGMMAHIHVSWLDPNKERKLTVVGSKKMVVFDDTEPSEKLRIYDKSVNASADYQTYGEYLALRTGDIVIPKIDSSEPLRSECLHFIDAVKKRTRPRSDGREGLKVVKILAAAQRSMQSGGTPERID